MDFCEVHSWQRHTARPLAVARWTPVAFPLPWVLLLGLLCAITGASAQSSSTITTTATPSQTSQRVIISSVPTSVALPPINASSPVLDIRCPAFAVSTIYLTLNICGLTSSGAALVPRVLVSSSDSIPQYFYDSSVRTVADPASGGVLYDADGVSRPNERALPDLWDLTWDKGFANWTFNGLINSDGSIVQTSVLLGLAMGTTGIINQTQLEGVEGNLQVQLSISGDRPLQTLASGTALLGDTTQNAVLLFSPVLLSQPHDQPTYPNYTLPPAQLSLAQSPFSASGGNLATDVTGLSSNLSLVVIPTGSSPTNDGLDNSYCAVQAAGVSTGSVAAAKSMLVNATTQWTSVGGDEGYKTYWVLGDLEAETNYTAWVVDNQGGMTQPIWFVTKPSDFPCQLALPSSLCPGVGYAAPISQNTTASPIPSTPYPISVLPDDMTSTITSSLDAFSTSVLSGACGRDLYSHVVSCADCYASYRDWVCRVVVAQCAASSSNDDGSGNTPPVEPKTVERSPAAPRLPVVVPPYEYTELLPCLSVCNSVDRDCILTLNFRCPLRNKVGNQSYAFYGEDDDQGDGSADTGQVSLDRWGNRWCNG